MSHPVPYLGGTVVKREVWMWARPPFPPWQWRWVWDGWQWRVQWFQPSRRPPYAYTNIPAITNWDMMAR